MNRLIILLLPVLLVVGCSSKEPINRDLMLIERDRLYYTKDTNKPYSGRVFTLYDNGENKLECGYKDGELDGLYTLWNKNGQKRKESNYKDGKLNGLVTEWYKNGEKEETTYKDDERHGTNTAW